MGDESNASQVKSILNADLNLAAKKKFKIPADIKLSQVKICLFIKWLINIYLTIYFQKKIKTKNIQKSDWTKPNSPVVLTVPSPKLQPKFSK